MTFATGDEAVDDDDDDVDVFFILGEFFPLRKIYVMWVLWVVDLRLRNDFISMHIFGSMSQIVASDIFPTAFLPYPPPPTTKTTEL